jgi:hypothetical protein
LHEALTDIAEATISVVGADTAIASCSRMAAAFWIISTETRLVMNTTAPSRG